MNCSYEIFKFYSYLANLLWMVLEVSPPPLRQLVYKILLKKLGKGSFIDYGTYIRYPFKVSIGNNVWINRNCSLYASGRIKNAEIILGNNVAIGPEVCIFSAGHDYNKLILPDIAKTVKIGDNVWIGGRSIILPGVEIGEGAVVGAGSIVTKNIGPYEIVAGNPAKFIKERKILD